MKALPDDVWSRTMAVQLETRLRHCKPLYEDQESCEQMRDYMGGRGFSQQVACRPGCPWCRPPSCEQNILYLRNGVSKKSFPAWQKNFDVG